MDRAFCLAMRRLRAQAAQGPPANIPVAGPLMSAMSHDNYSLSVLNRLEAESIHILRETAAEFERVVMMYSVGKDSSVMLRLAQKAFHPGRIPFPLLHVDTTWKFADMIRHRDAVAKQYGVNLIVHINEDGLARGINPIASGSSLHTQVMKTEALKQALQKISLEQVAAQTGITVEQIHEAATIFAEAPRSIALCAEGIVRQPNGYRNVLKLIDLAWITGKLGRPGCGVNTVTEEINEQGAIDMGAVPEFLPGQARFDDPAARQRANRAGRALPPRYGRAG